MEAARLDETNGETATRSSSSNAWKEVLKEGTVAVLVHLVPLCVSIKDEPNMNETCFSLKKWILNLQQIVAYLSLLPDLNMLYCIF